MRLKSLESIIKEEILLDILAKNGFKKKSGKVCGYQPQGNYQKNKILLLFSDGTFCTLIS